jgi:hypothetical protein
MSELTPAPVLLCANCHAPLEGQYCHACGQSVKSVLRPMHSMIEDTLDMVFHVDERIVHTLPPLFVKPGYLSLEYFAGRRVRYVAPFRLMFVFCLLALFAVHLSMGDLIQGGPTAVHGTGHFADDTTIAQVDARLKEAEQGFDEGEAEPGVPGLAAGLERARHATEREAAARRSQIDPTIPPPVDEPAAAHHGSTKLTDVRVTGPFANDHTKKWFARIIDNGAHLLDGDPESRERFVTSLFGVLPQTMFVMLPVFALLLKGVYLFRRRLYMEHIIVSLHSHAFLFLSVLFLALLFMLGRLLAPYAPWATTGLGWVSIAVWVWMPVYLLLMQKRVYRQGWPMTIFKYLVTGSFYGVLLFFALLTAIAISLSH